MTPNSLGVTPKSKLTLGDMLAQVLNPWSLNYPHSPIIFNIKIEKLTIHFGLSNYLMSCETTYILVYFSWAERTVILLIEFMPYSLIN